METGQTTRQQLRRFAVMLTAATAITITGCAGKQQVVLRDDSAITKDVQDRLGADATTSKSKVGVETKAGVVQLSGDVVTDTERSSAEKIARDTPGVRSVDNDVRFGLNKGVPATN